MMKRVRKLVIVLLVVLSIGGALSPTRSYATVTITDEQLALINISSIVNQEYISEEDVAVLETELAKLGIDAASYFTLEDYESMALARGYGQTHNLGGGWRARVDKPHTGEGLPHVHVENNKGVKGAESVLGTKSHKKTMSSSGIPNSVQKKVKGLKDYKKGQEDAKKIQKAKSQIKSKKLNLKKTTDIIIAIGIFVAVVGLVIFATSSIAAWGAFLLLI
ncbi:hypothetical protein ABER68_18820 [Paenibacillus alvei]